MHQEPVIGDTCSGQQLLEAQVECDTQVGPAWGVLEPSYLIVVEFYGDADGAAGILAFGTERGR